MKINFKPSYYLILFVHLLMVAINPNGFAQVSSANKKVIVPKLEKALPGIVDSAGIPGLAIAMAQGKKIAWCKGYGVSKQKTKKPETNQTVFRPPRWESRFLRMSCSNCVTKES